MGAKSRGSRSSRDPLSSNPLTAGVDGSGSRAVLLASASLIALVALAPTGPALACSGADQTISTIVSGPILSTGGSITVLGNGTINGGPTGVKASSCSVSTLTNSGSVSGEVGAAGAPGGPGGVGGVGDRKSTRLNSSHRR